MSYLFDKTPPARCLVGDTPCVFLIEKLNMHGKKRYSCKLGMAMDGWSETCNANAIACQKEKIRRITEKWSLVIH